MHGSIHCWRTVLTHKHMWAHSYYFVHNSTTILASELQFWATGSYMCQICFGDDREQSDTQPHLLLYIYLHTATGGLAAGAIGGIVIAAVVFALLNLIVIAVIVYCVRSRSKNQKSTHGVGDLQAEYHQLERSQSHAQPSNAISTKDSTHPDNQSNTVPQKSDRWRFLNRGVRRIFARDCIPMNFWESVDEKTITILRCDIFFYLFLPVL